MGKFVKNLEDIVYISDKNLVFFWTSVGDDVVKLYTEEYGEIEIVIMAHVDFDGKYIRTYFLRAGTEKFDKRIEDICNILNSNVDDGIDIIDNKLKLKSLPLISAIDVNLENTEVVREVGNVRFYIVENISFVQAILKKLIQIRENLNDDKLYQKLDWLSNYFQERVFEQITNGDSE